MIFNDLNIIKNLSDYWDTFMPSQYSVLLKGLTLGIDDLSFIPGFKQKLIITGTIHVVVVSGYNISLVLNVCQSLIGRRIKILHTFLYILVSLLYAVVTGFAPPIMRAWLMSTTMLIAKLSGRNVQGIYVLLFTCLLMIIVDTELLTSYSFILSSGATLGLLLYSDKLKQLLNKYVKMLPKMLIDDLSASLSASIIVTPVIIFAFSRVSFVSPLINMLLLWTIPVTTILGFLMVFTTAIDLILHTQFTPIIFFVIYPVLTIFISGIDFFGDFEFISAPATLTIQQLVIFYVLLFITTFVVGKYLEIRKCRATILS